MILKSIANNPQLLEAVKGVILAKFDKPATLSKDSGDILLGQHYRAQLLGRELVEEAFREIERLQDSEKKPEAVNLAR